MRMRAQHAHILLLLALAFSVACAPRPAWGLTDDQRCVQHWRGVCKTYKECAVGDMLDVCSSSSEVCCKRSADAQPRGSGAYPTAQIPLYMVTCPSSVDSRVGSLWLYADGRENIMYVYPDLPDAYYDCARYQQVTLTERMRVLSLTLQFGTLLEGTLVLEPTAVVQAGGPAVSLKEWHYRFVRPTGWPREDQLYPLRVTHSTLHLDRACSAPLNFLIAAQVRATTTYSQYNLTLMGGDVRVQCNDPLLPATTEAHEHCDALDYHMTTHRYEEGCKLLGDPSNAGCDSACTATEPAGARGLCLSRGQCTDMGGAYSQPCTQCTGAEGVCCVFAANPDDPTGLPPARDAPSPHGQRPHPGPSPPGDAVPLAYTPDSRTESDADVEPEDSFWLAFVIAAACLCCASICLVVMYRYYQRKYRRAYQTVSETAKTDAAATEKAGTRAQAAGNSDRFSRFDEDDSFIELDQFPEG